MFRRTQDPLKREFVFNYRTFTFCGRPFQVASFNKFFCNSMESVLQPREASFSVWALPCSLAATKGIDFSFSSSGYLDVSVLRVCLTLRYVFTQVYYSITNSGFPHSEIFGSTLTYSFPKHIGVSSVLHRLLVPRHPPCALVHLT